MRVSLINCFDEKYLDQIKIFYKANGFYIYEIDGQDVVDEQSLYSKLCKILPQDPPLSGKTHWDAFLDSVWEGFADLLETQGVDRIVLIWTKVENMLNGGLTGLLTAVDCFTNLADLLTEAHGLTKRIDFVVVLAGSGPNFRNGEQLELWR